MGAEQNALDWGITFEPQQPGYLNLCIRSGTLLITSGHTSDLKGVLGNAIELMDIFRGIMPYLGIVIFTMVLMYQFPGIALWLPDWLFAD